MLILSGPLVGWRRSDSGCRKRCRKMKPDGVGLLGFLVLVQEGVRTPLKPVQNGTFTGPIRGLGRVENVGLPWYNLNSLQTNLSIRHFNNLKSICRHSPELGWGGFSKSVFKA